MNRDYASFRHIALDDVDSTNTACLERARDGDPGGLWITARRQLQGRARRGRSWVSEAGNLYASLLLINVAKPADLATLPLAVSLAVHRAITAVLPPGAANATIKWPNDVLIGGAKISGILLESETLHDGRVAVVIGCGINVAHAPEQTMYRTTTLQAEGSGVSPDELFARLFMTMGEALDVWDGGRGIAAIRRSWLDNAEGIGKHIQVKLHQQTIGGIFAEIDQSGSLVLVQDDKTVRKIAAGDVFFK
ncbi:MAG: biotin--[acetyl-CoA-carboxylase] ligase [Pseudomonadota bacterium]